MGKYNDHIKFLVIDLFCGAGGTTTGAEDSGVCKVIAAVNHDPLAISSHAANHADVLHMTEDIVVVDIRPIVVAFEYWKQIYPNARFIDHDGESRKRAEIIFSCVLGNLCCFILSLGL